MMQVRIPGWRTLTLRHLVLDVNGTIALDGSLLPEVAERLEAVGRVLAVHLASGDTYGRLHAVAARLGLPAVPVTGAGSAADEKAAYVRRLGAGHVVAIGNGANDVAMLREAALGIAVLGPEGLAAEVLLAADVLAPSAIAAVDLLVHPQRLVATLRR